METATSTSPSDYDGEPYPEFDQYGYNIREQPLGTKRRVRVILMGAGASSLNFFKQAETGLQNVDITCYEKNKDIGGTWLENRYPGCACDVPSVNYQFSWKIRLWSHYYSYSPEIWEYLKEIERENNFIEKYIKLRHKIEHAAWDNEAGLWRLQIRDLEENKVFGDTAEFFINAGGVLNKWKWPDVPGLRNFKGRIMHSARYEVNYPLSGKRVAVLGAGSSGVQIVAAIQEKVDTLYHWVRSPIWITAGFAQTWAGRDGANFKYSPEQIEFLRNNPKKYHEYRKQIENELNQRFKFIIKGSEDARKARESAHEQMSRKLKHDPRLCESIIPKNFNPGCRRPTPAPGYLESLLASNAKVFTTSISKIDEDGFVQDGTHYDADVIICATGFDTSWLPHFTFVGKDKSIHELWSPDAGVTSYLSVGVPTFPNYLSFCGPYGPLGHGSFMPLIEEWTRYMFKIITKAQIENIKSFTPRMDASCQFRQHADLFLKRTAWTSPCRSWFKQGKADGQAGIWPGSRLHFLHMMKDVRYEDYEIDYWDENRFAFMGNGFDTREFDGRDITNYLGILNDEGKDVQPEYGEELMKTLAGWAIDEKYEVRGVDREAGDTRDGQPCAPEE
ncbi:FAD/NAD(P)-binding domain-containing protein [Pseudovirgaria hyperparasitica]|uniref:FAD/NAD(P)-binding domain-containing protein n=1 Tax=Pseudovirgaria hyperparasitica TaxID=470096 RepID=A0A6A6WAL3_9PEZI|nr:FAD/NAD(P)-binding domain-containing protein [Pseudovirgaria hyperparasitica]KAF2759074.1 FAD/NAD(P)-binding domain-containing protein [Pseudovirgaria hyperparasitica]